MNNYQPGMKVYDFDEHFDVVELVIRDVVGNDLHIEGEEQGRHYSTIYFDRADALLDAAHEAEKEGVMLIKKAAWLEQERERLIIEQIEQEEKHAQASGD